MYKSNIAKTRMTLCWQNSEDQTEEWRNWPRQSEFERRKSFVLICLNSGTGKKQSTVIHSIGKYFQTSGIIIVKAKDRSLPDECWSKHTLCIERRNTYLFGDGLAARGCRFSIIQFQTCLHWELFLLLGIAKIMLIFFGAKGIKNSVCLKHWAEYNVTLLTQNIEFRIDPKQQYNLGTKP